MTSTVSYDIYHEPLRDEKSRAVKFKRFWEKGFMSIYSDIPYLLRGRHRLGKAKQGILAARRKRFSLRMSGMSLVTLGNIAYSYFQDTRLGPYAYAFSFANRLIGYIKIPGMMELQPKEGMPLLKCPYKCKGDFEGGLHACSCRSKPICNNLIGHAFLERVVKDMIADATARLRMNNQAAVYINDEKNASEPANLSIPIPVVPMIPERQSSERTASVRQNRTFSDVLLVMGTVLNPKEFPTIKDEPRQQQYHIESKNIVTFSDKINGNLQKAYTVIKKDRATFTHIDVHFGRGGDTSAAKLESAATNKRKEYREAHKSFREIVRELQERLEPTTPRARVLCEIERLERSISAKPNVVTFGVNYDGVFTREAQSFMHRLAKIKYPAVEGCQNYLVTRSNWIDHWVKAIQSGLVNTLAKGMAQSYTDLAAQHAVARAEPVRPFTPPPVPQGIPRFTFRGIAHPTGEAFPPYLQPEAVFIDGLDQVEMVDTDNGDGSSAISSVSSRSQGSGGLLEQQRRNLSDTPPRGPLDRLPPEQLMKETEEYASVPESPVSPAVTRSVDLVRLNEECGSDDARLPDDGSLDQETSQSLVPHPQDMDLDSSIAESSQSIIPHSLQYGLRSTNLSPRVGDLVVVHLRRIGRGRNRRLVTSSGIVKEVDSKGYVKTDTCPNHFRKVVEICIRRSTSMISNNTQSSSEYSNSQYY